MLLLLSLLACQSEPKASGPKAPSSTSKASTEPFALPGAHVSRGPATVTNPGLIDCGKGSRPSRVGTATATDGTTWTVPAETLFTTAPKATDLYNACSGVEHAGPNDISLSTVPVVDAGGEEEFVGYIFGDNYFELSVNGRLVAVDSVPFTPFNASVVRFKASRPVTVAFKLVDWEENLGLGSEKGRGSKYQPGDGGLVAHFKDASGKTVLVTDNNWKAQTFYTSPLRDPACVKLKGKTRDSAACPTDGMADGTGNSAIFWDVPANWTDPAFDDGDWPAAAVFTNDTVGVDNKPAYTNFTALFDDPKADAQFIWSSNLILDNLVLTRGLIP